MRGVGVHALGAGAWASAARSARDLAPGALPDVAAALAGGFPGARPQGFVVEDPGGTALVAAVVSDGLLGPSVEALPYSLSCGPATLAGRPQPLDVGSLRSALRAQRVTLAVHHAYGARLARSLSTTTHVIDLAAGRPRPRQLVRRKLRAAARDGVEIRYAAPGATDSLLPILAAASVAGGRTPYPDEVVAAVANCSAALVVVATHAGRDVSAGLFIHSTFELFYWLGGTLPEAAGVSPSYAVIDTALAFAADRGCRWANLGSSDGLPGVAFFKEGFGAHSVPSPVVAAEARRHTAVNAICRRIGR